MSKKFWALAPLALATMLSPHAFAGTPSTASMPFTLSGSVTGSVCQAEYPQTIVLGPVAMGGVPLSTITKPSEAAAVTSTLSLTGCEAGQIYTVTLLGTGDAKDPNVLANVADDRPATDIGVAVFSGMKALHVGSKTDAITVKEDGTSTMQIFMAMVKTSTSPSEGDVKVTGQLQIDYL